MIILEVHRSKNKKIVRLYLLDSFGEKGFRVTYAPIGI